MWFPCIIILLERSVSITLWGEQIDQARYSEKPKEVYVATSKHTNTAFREVLVFLTFFCIPGSGEYIYWVNHKLFSLKWLWVDSCPHASDSHGGNYLLKVNNVNNGNNRIISKISSKLKLKTPERHQ